MVDRIRWDTVSYLPFYYVFFQFLLLTIFNLQANILTTKDILSNLAFARVFDIKKTNREACVVVAVTTPSPIPFKGPWLGRGGAVAILIQPCFCCTNSLLTSGEGILLRKLHGMLQPSHGMLQPSHGMLQPSHGMLRPLQHIAWHATEIAWHATEIAWHATAIATHCMATAACQNLISCMRPDTRCVVGPLLHSWCNASLLLVGQTK